MTIPRLDSYGRQVFTEDDAVHELYVNPDLDLSVLDLVNVDQFNRANAILHYGYTPLTTTTMDCTPEEYHRANQQNWHMPSEYRDFDIAKWCLDQCENQEQLQRTGKELLMFQERELMDLLKFLKYFVETLRENNVVWGVGRGSSVSSYVLYLIGVHKIDSIYYDLDVEDFLR